jgi:hypothetical protein
VLPAGGSMIPYELQEAKVRDRRTLPGLPFFVSCLAWPAQKGSAGLLESV